MASVRAATALAASIAVVAVAGCGKADDTPPQTAPPSAQASPAAAAARNPKREDFPAAAGRSLQQLADSVGSGVQLGLATSVLLPGENRLGFGLIRNQEFAYGPTAVYVARASPKNRAEGPYLAPADSLVTERKFQSEEAASDIIESIYAARVPFAAPGRYWVLAVMQEAGALIGAASQVRVARSSPIPDVGEPAPRVSTDTLGSAGGKMAAIETRRPPDDMHSVNFREVLGKKPVAVVFSTPQLCESRVCGPVTDIAAQLQERYRGRVEFIHQEVFVGNDMRRGFRKPLRAFRLQTEPWLFTVDRRGRVAARLEGSFGLRAFDAAVKAALG